MSKSNLKVIYSLCVHIELQSRGFEYITEMKNPNNQKLNCWVYEDNAELRNALDSLMEKGGRGK